MAERDGSLFSEIARIEERADGMVAEANAAARRIREKAERDVAGLARDTDQAIEQARAKLAREFQTKTEQALTHIDTEFLKDEDDLETIRETRFEELVEWTARHIRDHLVNPNSNGD